MRAADLGALALESLRGHRLRTGLTLLAVAIGVTAVLVLTAMGDAAKRYIASQFASAGANLIIVLPGRTETMGFGSAVGGSTRPLTLDDLEAVRRRAAGVRDVCPVALGTATIEWERRRRDVFVVGSTATMAEMRGLHVGSGSFLPAGDSRRDEALVVIGAKIAREVFAGANPVGRSVRLGQWRFRVIGVLESKGQSLGFDFDDMAIVPVATCMQMFNLSSIHRALVQATDASSVGAVMARTRDVLRDRHDEEDFTLITQDAMLATFRRILDALTVALAGIAAISLAVAGIGIMNVMLVSVSERVSEVGLLKAVGGYRRQVTAIFLVEAVMLSGLGGVLGVLLGIAATLVAGRLWPAFPMHASPLWIAVVIAFALVSGAVFGLLPARRAASLQVVDALRSGT